MKRAYVVLTVALASAIAAMFLMSPVTLPTSTSQEFTVPPTSATAACPGPQRVPVGDAGASGDLAAATDDKELNVWGSGVTVPVDLGTAWEGVIGSSVERVGDGDLMGLAAVSCTTASFDDWLVGGSTSLGSSARLVFTNPAGASAQATVTLYGPLGQVGEPFVVAVPARSQEQRLVEGVAAELRTLAVHVVSTGPGLVVAMQDSRLDGFQPAGSDWVAATQPLTRHVIPSVGSETEGSTAQLRLMAPEGAAVSVTLVTEDGIQAWSGARRLDLEPGVVTDVTVPINELGALEITSDKPVLAAARTVVTWQPEEGLEGDVAADHRWVAGIDESQESTLHAVVPMVGATIAVYSPVTTTATFTDVNGAVVARVTIPARTVQRVPVDAAPGTEILATGRLAWVVELSNEEETFIASVMAVNTDRADLEVAVRAVPYFSAR